MGYGYAVDALVYDGATGTWSLSPDYDLTTDRVEIQISDDDGYLDGDENNNEVGDDFNQLSSVYDMDGNLIASGQIYDESFFKLTGPGGEVIYIEAMEIGGQFVGWLVTAPLEKGVTYTETDAGNTTYDNALQYSQLTSVPCFAPGTMIDTPTGARAVETLKVGDLISTVDNGAQRIKWVHHGSQILESTGTDCRPVEIRANALGPGKPAIDLIVSPQHRILVGGSGQLVDLLGPETLAPAKALTGLKGIRFMRGLKEITWVHFACAKHQVVMANGCYSESLLLGQMVVRGLPIKEQFNVLKIFGGLGPCAALNGPVARRCLKVGQVQRVIDASVMTLSA